MGGWGEGYKFKQYIVIWYIIRQGFEKEKEKKFLELLLKGILEIEILLKLLESSSIFLKREKGRNFNNLVIWGFV